MKFSEFVLYQLAKYWPSPMAEQVKKFNAEPGTDAYAMAYAHEQFARKTRIGIMVDVWDKDVLEIGCGHGGITCFLAVAGAHHVSGIDISEERLVFARQFAAGLSQRFGDGYALPVEFRKEDAVKLTFEDASFDMVLADNVFEHFIEPEAVIREVARVLRPGGVLVVPTFSSILSKYGLHLKHGLKLPWANLLFSEGTIINVLHRLADNDLAIKNVYIVTPIVKTTNRQK